MCLRKRRAHSQLLGDLIGLRKSLASSWSGWGQWDVRRVFLRGGGKPSLHFWKSHWELLSSGFVWMLWVDLRLLAAPAILRSSLKMMMHKKESQGNRTILPDLYPNSEFCPTYRFPELENSAWFEPLWAVECSVLCPWETPNRYINHWLLMCNGGPIPWDGRAGIWVVHRGLKNSLSSYSQMLSPWHIWQCLRCIKEGLSSHGNPVPRRLRLG